MHNNQGKCHSSSNNFSVLYITHSHIFRCGLLRSWSRYVCHLGGFLALLMSWTNITWSPTPIHCPWPTSHGDIIAHYSTQEASDYRFFKCWLPPTFIHAPRKSWPRLSNLDHPSHRISSPDLSVSVPGWDSLDKSALVFSSFSTRKCDSII